MSSARTRSLGRRTTRVARTTSVQLQKKPPTKDLLIDTAEQLFGSLGIDGVSLREITTAAGQANSNVVQYHFKDKSGLVAAILIDRAARMESIRRERLRALKASGLNEPRALLRVLWEPMLSIVDGQGAHSYCRFMLQVMLQSYTAEHPIRKVYETSIRADARSVLPQVVKATRMLRAHYGHLPVATLNQRMSALSMMFLATVVEHDNARLAGQKQARAPFDVEPILDMAIASLAAGSGVPNSR